MRVFTVNNLSLFRFVNRFNYFLLLTLLFLFFNMHCSLFAQFSSNMDLVNVRSSQVSDSQLKKLIVKSEERGLTLKEALDFAVTRGLSQNEASKLLTRGERFTSNSGSLDAIDSFNRTNVRKDSNKEINFINNNDDFLFGTLLVTDRIFGSELFNAKNPTFEPDMNIPTPVNYILGVGDDLMIDIWGASNNFYKLTVSFEGTVVIDNVGPVYVQGLTIEEAEKRIISKLKTLYRGLNQDTFINISLGQVRSIQVTVMGEVYEPGSYTLTSLSTVFNALFKSGGITDKGSYRNIEVIRNNKVIEVFDVYDILLKGDQSKNIRLNDQDIIKVNVYKNRVRLLGNIKRPAYYEVLEDESLSQVISNAGSFDSDAYTKLITVDRYNDIEKEIVTVSQDDFDNFKLKDGDKIHIHKTLNKYKNKVVIAGAVWRAGRYELTDGLTLKQLIDNAEGLRPEAFKTRGVIYRVDENHDFYVSSFNLNDIYENPELYDIKLQYEDSIVIRNIYEMREDRKVKLSGEVQVQGEYSFKENMTLGDLILMGNGFKSSASEAKIEIYRRVYGDAAPSKRDNVMSEHYVFGISRDLILEGDAKDFVLEPFDQVYVRQRPDYQVQRLITIAGEVLFPGEYVLENRHQRISEIIAKAGGLTDEAFVKGISLERINRNADRIGTKIDNSSEDRIYLRRGATSYIGIDVEKALKNPGGKEDIFLREGDKIVVPLKLQTVAVDGAVLRATEVRYIEGKRLKYYINNSGGFTDKAKRNKAFVIYANGDVKTTKSFLMFKTSPKIIPGAEIIVPEKILNAKLTPSERISLLSSIVSVSAVVVTAISTVSRNQAK